MQMPHTPTIYDYDATIGGRVLNTSHDPFSTATFYNPSMSTKGGVDRNDTFGVFLDTQSLYQYYGSSNMATYNLGRTSVPDYVNPNAVLPMSYNEKLKLEAQKYDDQLCITTSANMSPILSTNDVTSVPK